MSPEPRPPSAVGTTDRTGVLALFAFVFAARLWLINSAGSPVPFWDQWDAEALALYRPWLAGEFDWRALFAAHNEHRIVFTRLSSLGLLVIGGAWNPWWQMTLNAGLHATTAAGLYHLARPAGKIARPAALLMLGTLFASPAGWQNALWGFQSQVYFGNLFALLALAGLAGGSALGRLWWLGWLCGLLALFANGSGMLVAIAALPLVALSPGYRGDHVRHLTIPLLCVSGLLLVGWCLQVEAPHHAYLRAKDWSGFLTVALHCLSWPWVESLWLWLLAQAPAIWLAITLLRERRRPEATERLLLGLVLWAALHAAAIAWSRGAGLPDGRPLSRYQDPLLFGAAANFLILLRLAATARSARLAALVWCGGILAGMLTLSTHVLSLNLPYKRQQDAAGLAQIHTYLATRDASALGHASGSAPLHPDARVVQNALDDPALRTILPAEFSDLTARPPFIVTQGVWLTLLALAGLLLTCQRPRTGSTS